MKREKHKKIIRINTSKRLKICESKIQSLLKLSVFLQTALAAETYLAEWKGKKCSFRRASRCVLLT
jgi:hypothetical protein